MTMQRFEFLIHWDGIHKNFLIGPTRNNMQLQNLFLRGKVSFDQAGVGADKPAQVKKEDDDFDLYRKRMMLSYKFRPNPLVRTSSLVY